MMAVLQVIRPGWQGDALPAAFPWWIRWVLASSVLVVSVFSILCHFRPFFLLRDHEKEALLEHLAHHRLATIRSLVQWWKLVAMVTHVD